jgi:hypothetical protein
VLIRERRPDEAEQNPWGIRFMRMFDMATDSALFETTLMRGQLPLYEAKMIHQLDHRWATYEGASQGIEPKEVDEDDNEDEERKGPPTRDVTLAEKRDPNYEPSPRYWVDERHVLARSAPAPGFMTKAYLAEQHRSRGLKLKDARDAAKALPLEQALLLWWCGSWLAHQGLDVRRGLKRVQAGRADDSLGCRRDERRIREGAGQGGARLPCRSAPAGRDGANRRICARRNS